MTLHPHAITQASSWVMRWSHLIPSNGKVLDLACGHGRHMQWLKQQGFACLGVDRDEQALLSARAFGDVMQAD
ncbi:MAG: class I SAM-dependent methyltransferase, partial [Limnohabitans sp.]